MQHASNIEALNSSAKVSGLIVITMLIGLNLRPALAAIGPLTSAIQQDTGMSFTAMAWLTLLPVLAMGLGCFVTLKLRQQYSLKQLVQGSLGLLVIANGLRVWDTESLAQPILLLTSLLAGTGIAVLQATLPVVIKTLAGDDSARVMGFYVSAIMGGAALAASVSPWLTSGELDWRMALAVWSLLALVALVCWQQWSSQLPQQSSGKALHHGVARSRQVSLIATFSMAAAGYVCILAWLPPFLLDLGFSATQAGLLLGYLTAVEVAAGFIFPSLASKNLDRRWVLTLVMLLSVTGFVWLALIPQWASIVFPLTLLGLGIGGQFPMVMIVTMDHHPNAQKAGSLVAVVQGYGYSLAAFMPLLMGALRDQLGQFELAWLALAGIYLVAIILVSRYNPRHYQALRSSNEDAQ
ncbi:MFS transporter [Bacterioplanes sanyensis]|uniref:MFS transporter n=1 Tax=Bacterioplanes sanyensis TaxID=1249553 RepID=A0A222FM11_9GAMM|nr:MFS transporter [Bacterioplanes sanyensis]ASP40048.1 MFS transporter [Bacterioplanes sanyensis]